MIRISRRDLTPLRLGLLITVTMATLLMSVPEAVAYMAPPVPYPIDAEGDGDDFYNHQVRLRGRQDGRGHHDGRGPDVRIPDDPVITSSAPVDPNPLDDHALGTGRNLTAGLARWAWVIRVVRGF